MTRKFLILWITLVLFGAVRVSVYAQAQAPSPSPLKSQKAATPRPALECCGYPFPRSLDAEIADGDVHRVLYDDSHVMLLEVNNPPGIDMYMHGHPYASVFAHDSNIGPKAPGPQPPFASGDSRLDPESPYNDMGSGEAPPPEGMQWP